MWEFMVQTEKKIEAVRSIESKDWDFEAHKVRFSSSHVFSVNREEKNNEDFLKKWVTKPIDPKNLSLAETTKYEIYNVPNLFSKGNEEDDDFFTSDTGDLLDYLNTDSNINPYNQTFMSILRKESESIANFEDAVTALHLEEKVMRICTRID